MIVARLHVLSYFHKHVLNQFELRFTPLLRRLPKPQKLSTTCMNTARLKVDGDVLYTVAGQEVCETCFRMVYDLRYNRFIMIKKKFSKGVVHVEHGMLGKGLRVILPYVQSAGYTGLLKKVGDHMPMKQDIHLPSCLTKADVYSLASDDLCQGGLQCCGTSTFKKIWQKEFPHVVDSKGRYTYIYNNSVGW